MKLIGWALIVILGLIAITFSVHNYQTANLDLWPLPYTIGLPLFAIVMAAMTAGFLIGVVVIWLAGGRYRGRAREQGRELRSARIELEREKQSRPPPHSAPRTPNLPVKRGE